MPKFRAEVPEQDLSGDLILDDHRLHVRQLFLHLQHCVPHWHRQGQILFHRQVPVHELLDCHRILVCTWSVCLLLQAEWATVQIRRALTERALYDEDLRPLVPRLRNQDCSVGPHALLLLLIELQQQSSEAAADGDHQHRDGHRPLPLCPGGQVHRALQADEEGLAAARLLRLEYE